SATDVPDDVAESAKPVRFVTVESEKPQDRQHAFRIRVETDGELYVQVKKGLRAPGDYPLSEDYDAVVEVRSLPREVRIQGDGGSERGLFFLTAQGWDPIKKKPIGGGDSRFILVTDIGMLTKKNADASHEVFLMSIKEGKPLANVTVDLLGKNGIPLQTAKTDANGRCAFTSVEKSIREKTPVAFVARNGDDVSFIPYAREDRQLNFSRFDIDGVDNVLPE